MADQTEIHNAIAGKIVESIIRPVIESGGEIKDILVLTESVLVGVTLACIRLGGDNEMLDVMIGGARQRLAEARLRDLGTAGSA